MFKYFSNSYTKKQSVLYFDFELSDKQFQNRYSKDYEDNYIYDKEWCLINKSLPLIT